MSFWNQTSDFHRFSYDKMHENSDFSEATFTNSLRSNPYQIQMIDVMLSDLQR